MKTFFRTISIILAWFSLLSVPVAYFSYACEAGLCGIGSPMKARFFGYYTLCYPLLILFCLYQCQPKKGAKEHEQVPATILIFPLIYFLFFLWHQLT